MHDTSGGEIVECAFSHADNVVSDKLCTVFWMFEVAFPPEHCPAVKGNIVTDRYQVE